MPPEPTLPPHPALRRYYRDEKRAFVRRIFDEGAPDYDRVEKVMALGSGSWYRRRALARAGLHPGMRVLDVAVGTGLVAREEVRLLGTDGARSVFGLDPSSGMLAQARRSLTIPVVMGIGEQLPFADDSFDFVSMGYALRHVSDLSTALAEFGRVLRPGGVVCILELTAPGGRFQQALLRAYVRDVVPRLSRLLAPAKSNGNGGPSAAPSKLLWEYYWDTIVACVPPEQVLAALSTAGFADVHRERELGIFSEYTARKPLPAARGGA